MDKKEINCEYKAKALEKRHETFQILGIAFSVVTVLCSVIWAICLYNLEAIKHPVDYSNKVQVKTNYERK